MTTKAGHVTHNGEDVVLNLVDELLALAERSLEIRMELTSVEQERWHKMRRLQGLLMAPDA